ncbi:biotin/lipoyl-containing protein [Enterococcus avium]|uniref:biotin/lipoyl-containing protein n=1 Tax=Enterococcus avium TaxID=33945 RepID=UPI00288D838B|nr:biotin/lipoyl-containing protein [Enterococcus avium]MDT2426823.1 biotin/lipoyl-binding protein [Enterococcus avium]
MKQYEISVDGQVYKVALREIGEEEAAQVSKTSGEDSSASIATSNGQEVPAPMAGNILSVNVKTGDTVNAGDTLVILEAMKMENEIVSPIDGVVSSVLVQSNQTVESGELLIVL